MTGNFNNTSVPGTEQQHAFTQIAGFSQKPAGWKAMPGDTLALKDEKGKYL